MRASVATGAGGTAGSRDGNYRSSASSRSSAPNRLAKSSSRKLKSAVIVVFLHIAYLLWIAKML
jgi:hypothetical protein